MSGITRELPQVLPWLNWGAVSARLHHALGGALARSRTRRIVAGLSEDQLRDAGIDRSGVLGNKPVISVAAGVATYLESLR
jgi:uncharacterized protein YjiS (DUF1127 family)